MKRIPNDVASLPKKYSAEAPHDCQFEGAFKNVQYQYFSTDYKEPGAVSFSELVQALDLNTQDMESQISNDLKMQLPGKAKEMGELPENRRPICEIQSKIELRENPDFTVTVSVNLSAFYKDEELRRSVSAKKSTRQLFQEFREKNRESTEDILGAVECAAREAARGGFKDIPYCRLPIEGVLESYRSFLAPQGVRYGRILAVCTDIQGIYHPSYCAYNGNGQAEFVVQKKKKRISAHAVVLKDLERYAAQPIKLSSKCGIPQNLISFNKFCEEASVLYDAYAKKVRVEMPELHFEFTRGVIGSCVWGRRAVGLSDTFQEDKTYETTIRARLIKLFDSVYQSVLEQEKVVYKQIEVLSTLNPSEFAILEYIHQQQRSWYTNINDALEGKVLTTKVSTGPYLDHLCKMKMVVDGKKVPLLQYEWAYSRKHDDFRLYTSPVDWDKASFERAVPRDFTVDEMSDMHTPGKEKFFKDALKKAVDPAFRWNAMAILEHMSKVYAAGFAKTAEGRGFFQSFGGDDALYAKFFLESLPGCKRLAKEYFPD